LSEKNDKKREFPSLSKPQPSWINLILKKFFLDHFLQSIQYAFLGRIVVGDRVLTAQCGCDFSRAIAGSDEDGYSFVRIK
jgi:hypothetical protein